MKFSFCSCLKRVRSTYSISSKNINDTNSNSNMPTITLAPLPLLSDMPVVPIESDYEKIVDSSGDGEIGIVNVDQNLAKSMEYENHTKLTSIRLQQQSSDDDTELYATVDKIRTVNNGTRIKTNATSTIGSNLRQDSILTSTTAPSSQPIPSASLHSTGFTITPEHLTSPPLPPPPLPPLPLQVYTDTIASTIANDHDNISTHRPYYEEVIVRESLQDRAQYSPIEEDQNQQEQQLNENYYSSVNSERETTTSSDIYAEIANSSESGIVYQNPQYHYYSRPSNDIGIGDDTSEHYATVIELSNTEEDCTGSCLYQDVDS